MEFIPVMNESELPPNQMKVVDVGSREVLLVNIYGQYHAIANKCTHMGGSLGSGKLEGTCVRCPRHGAAFDLLTGKAVEGAKIGFLKVKVKDEDCFPVKVEGGEILVGTEKILEPA